MVCCALKRRIPAEIGSLEMQRLVIGFTTIGPRDIGAKGGRVSRADVVNFCYTL